jgi:hypothetical protein
VVDLFALRSHRDAAPFDAAVNGAVDDDEDR